jgi:hypothetical protein
MSKKHSLSPTILFTVIGLLLSACAGSPATPLVASEAPPTAMPPTAPPTQPSPTAEPTTPPASPTPAVRLTVDDMVGFWHKGNAFVQYRADGSVSFTHILESLYLGDVGYRFKFSVEGDLLTEQGNGVPDCSSNYTNVYQLQDKQEDRLAFKGINVECHNGLGAHWPPHDPSFLRLLPKGTSWVQMAEASFNKPENIAIQGLSLFTNPAGESYYFLSTLNPTTGAQVWRRRLAGGGGVVGTPTWGLVVKDGFGNPANVGIAHLLEFKDQLYAGAMSNEKNGGEVWRSANGAQWDQVASAGFGDPTNAEIVGFVEFNSQLYASTRSLSSRHGGELWRSDTGDAGDWERVAADGFGDSDNQSLSALTIFNKALFAGTANPATGPQVWRSANGTDWAPVTLDGFGVGNQAGQGVTAMAVFADQLYVATAGAPDASVGVEVWRCQVCEGGDWTRVVENGFGNAEMSGRAALVVHNDQLYLVAGNSASGQEVWSTADGAEWETISESGIGNPNNVGVFSGNSVISMKGRLLIGTENEVEGGQLWVYLP